MNEEVTELKPAYWWQCPDCSNPPQFIIAKTPELTDEQIDEAREMIGVESWKQESVQQIFFELPNRVVCIYCHARFKTEVQVHKKSDEEKE